MPLTLAAYWLLPKAWRNGLLTAFSIVFYSWGGGAFILLLLAAIAVNYLAGILIDSRALATRLTSRRVVLAATVAGDVSVLLVWKYAGFASRQIFGLEGTLGLGHTAVLDLALPIGISFFTFHNISYVVDIYRHTTPAQRHPLRFVTYIAMFPQLIAGPIVRYHEIADQLGEVPHSRIDDLVSGFPRFALGLAKKVVVADTIGPVAAAGFAAGGDMTTATAWLAALAYALQIYFDFSGYSDMAIGLGRMFGFRLPENFARPYSAVSITDFWRRWHMSLSRWFRDYVYIPLGGNRSGRARTYTNLLVVFLLVGFWHGADWTFLAWGLYHGGWLVVERITGLSADSAGAQAILRRAATFLIVVVGWVFFRSADLASALHMLHLMFVPQGAALSLGLSSVLTREREVTILLASLVVLLPGSLVLGRVVEEGRGRLAAGARYLVMGAAAPSAAMLVAAGTFSPFLYYRF